MVTNTYDNALQLTAMADWTGVTTYTYDAAGRERSVVYPLVGALTETLDANGNGTTYAYAFVPAGQVTRVETPGGYALGYAYDPVGNKKHVVDPDGGATCYQYDGVDNLVGTYNPFGEASGMVYDALNRETKQFMANGVNRNRGFDADGRMVSLSYQTSAGTLRLMHTLTYDAAANLLSHREQDGALTIFSAA